MIIYFFFNIIVVNYQKRKFDFLLFKLNEYMKKIIYQKIILYKIMNFIFE